jgi:hypothetical protein
MKIGKIDIVFLIVYLIILIWMIMSIDLMMAAVGGSTPEYVRWNRVSYILLYAIFVPIVYLVIRSFYSRKK